VEIPALSLSSSFVRELYSRMLFTRIMDEHICAFHQRDETGFSVSCRGREAAQVGSAVCIKIGNDFTLPYFRDLGVVLTIGMTPFEVFRSYVRSDRRPVHTSDDSLNAEQNFSINASGKHQRTVPQWSYSKHNMVAGSTSIATQVLHAAGIAFAAKLRKAAIVAVSYCGDGAASEPDFLEGITFAVQHQLPFVCIYEQTESTPVSQSLPLPAGLTYHSVDGTDIIKVYTAMRTAMEHARAGNGPVLLEMHVAQTPLDTSSLHQAEEPDPLIRCQRYLAEHGLWDEEWATHLRLRFINEVELALQEVKYE
jgi:2-oxoisovalerate dehydrogenase E1 component alpha subunit